MLVSVREADFVGERQSLETKKMGMVLEINVEKESEAIN